MTRMEEEIREVIGCDADAETKCRMISNILTAKPYYFEEQEPCDDCISLEAVKNTMFMVQRTAFISDNEFHRTMDLLMRLPPVTPAEKVGHWIDGKCNRCGTHAPYWAMASTYYCSDYCPKCGAKMQEVEE